MTARPAFRTSEIRRGMDAFGIDGQKIGMVIQVVPGHVPETEGDGTVPGKPEQRMFDGEAIGPAPTRELGNFGPATQSPENRYGSTAIGGDPLGTGSIQIGTMYSWFGRIWIPLEEVQTVSMERVVLRKAAAEYA
jgi:hypothetical protein